MKLPEIKSCSLFGWKSLYAIGKNGPRYVFNMLELWEIARRCNIFEEMVNKVFDYRRTMFVRYEHAFKNERACFEKILDDIDSLLARATEEVKK